MSRRRDTLLFKDEFLAALGMFHGAWSDADLTVDYAIGQFLNLQPEQTHLLTSGMMFGRKAQLLAGLIARSDHAQKTELVAALNVLRGEIRRDWIAHAYLMATDDTVTFIHRNVSGEYRVNELTFTLTEFLEHAKKLAEAALQLQKALDLKRDKQEAFIESARKAVNKNA